MIYRAEENASTGQIEAQPYAGMVETTPAPDALCTTAAATAAKFANAPGYTLRTGNRFTMMLANANSAQSALTLNVNETGAKPIYINGAASSSSNYTLPAGDYEVLYDGTNYQIRTDLSIAGTVAIGNGGTGATAALGARQNLGVADASNLAPTEATRTMSAQRTAGSYVYVTADDQFYQITTTIAANGTLIPGTNATAKSIADVLATLNSDLTDVQNNLVTTELSFNDYITLDANKAVLAGNRSVCSTGKMITLQIDITTKPGVSGDVTIGSTTLRPKKSIFPVAIKWTGSIEYKASEINYVTGNITIFGAVANSEYTILATYAIP